MEDKDKILLFAREKFFREGFYKTSMDELARELKMSKKTIYKYFPSKEKLVENVVDNLLEETSGKIKSVLEKNVDAVSKILDLLGILSNIFLKISDKWLKDMQYNTPHLWAKIDAFRTRTMYMNIGKIFEQGKAEGLFEERPVELLMVIFISSMRAIVSPEFLLNHKFSFNEAVEQAFQILLNGILTNKGANTLKNSIKQDK
ncbi:MAG: TetR/AcrR family transcriptional regulator [Ignavibacteria bacterium]|jgi:AcrR family transcriptional regulator|nr:TetR/AcrR family transcriptional regulator [Ignavibacteria bacterium]MCU7503330.1 TetR/AcrR family transcriptional regulator [Ignavibacteria bacterium]MCU7515724.1 TetR/AcrR family transcriptional regulator [Ignavibacteria bacterium]